MSAALPIVTPEGAGPARDARVGADPAVIALAATDVIAPDVVVRGSAVTSCGRCSA